MMPSIRNQIGVFWLLLLAVQSHSTRVMDDSPLTDNLEDYDYSEEDGGATELQEPVAGVQDGLDYHYDPLENLEDDPDYLEN